MKKINYLNECQDTVRDDIFIVLKTKGAMHHAWLPSQFELVVVCSVILIPLAPV